MKIIVILLCLCFCGHTIDAQEKSVENIPDIALKTNLLYLGTTTPNLGMEVGISPKFTIESELGLNPFSGKNTDGTYGKSIKHFRLHTELRYWFCERFYGHFIGLHTPLYIYNISDISWLGTEGERHQGWSVGAGISYGYNWILSKNWNLEATVGFGYLHLMSEKYPCTSCGNLIDKVGKHYVGPTQAALSAVYVF